MNLIDPLRQPTDSSKPVPAPTLQPKTAPGRPPLGGQSLARKITPERIALVFCLFAALAFGVYWASGSGTKPEPGPSPSAIAAVARAYAQISPDALRHAAAGIRAKSVKGNNDLIRMVEGERKPVVAKYNETLDAGTRALIDGKGLWKDDAAAESAALLCEEAAAAMEGANR